MMKKFRVFVRQKFFDIAWKFYQYRNLQMPVELLVWALNGEAMLEAWYGFDKIGYYEYSDLFKIGDTWFVNKTWKPYVWPELNVEDLLSVQPLSAPTNIKFELRYQQDDIG